MADTLGKMPDELRRLSAAHRNPIEIKIGNVPLTWKLDALAAALVSVRDAHRYSMGGECWAEINQALAHLAEAQLTANDEPEVKSLAP